MAMAPTPAILPLKLGLAAPVKAEGAGEVETGATDEGATVVEGLTASLLLATEVVGAGIMQVEAVGGKTLIKRSPEEKVPFSQRLARIEGQVRGLRQMIEDDRSCSEQLQQITAVIAALREVALLSISQQVAGQIDLMTGSPAGGGEIRELVELLRSTFRLT